MRNLSLNDLKEGIINQNKVVLARAITLAESNHPAHQALCAQLLELLMPYTQGGIRIGISGVPGVGKSTFINVFGQKLIDKGHKVAVLAIDPSSPVSKGSILGDKTRMGELATNPAAFIRPSPAGKQLGGVAQKTREAMLLCQAAGFDVLLIETVGVGQSETAVKDMVDFFLLLMLSGAGDELQGIKKGIMEMADALVITKADGSNLVQAQKAQQTYQNALHLAQPHPVGWIVPTLTCSAYEKKGFEQIIAHVFDFEKRSVQRGFWKQNRSMQSQKWLLETLENGLLRHFFEHPNIKEQLPLLQEQVARSQAEPHAVAQKLLNLFFANNAH